MNIATADKLPRIQLSGIFLGVASLMTVYESGKEFVFSGTLTSWESHLITILVTATFATTASFFMRKWAVRIDEQLRIAATAFEAQEGMLITDADSNILRVNHAFTRITGYASDEVVGRNPRLLSSGRQDEHFYTAMWKSINLAGAWEGEVWNRRKSGEIYPEYLTITAVKNMDGNVTNYVATFTDITISRKKVDEIKHLAFYDPLTLLPNRRLLIDRLQQALISSGRNGHSGALMFIDLDNFKALNDTLGHDIGDLLLQQVARRLEASVREGDTVARMGGDEFVVMLEDLSDDPREATTQTAVIGQKILFALNQPYQLEEHEYRNTPSIGATLFKSHQRPLGELLKQADTAMYQSKKAGRNTLRFFEDHGCSVASSSSAL